MEKVLNRLQARWAKKILGIGGFRQGAWALVVAECGWTRPLASQMFIEAIMLEARVLLMPQSCAATKILLIALEPSHSLPSWARGVAVLRARLDALMRLGNIPDIRTLSLIHI